MIKFVTKFLIAGLFLTITFYNCSDSVSTDKGKDKPLSSSLQPVALPQDVDNTCSVDGATFASWFADGKATENGVVNPANSIAFPDSNNGNFYKWSEQMFLWLTSKGTKYGSEGLVIESPVFYTASPELPDSTRALIPYKKGDGLDATVDIAKISTEEGQATNNVLLDKNGDLVYYITMVNDVYATLLKAAAKDGSKVNRFPTTKAELDNLLITSLEPNALAIELKTAWVKLGNGMNKEDYVTIQSDIPVYNQKNPKQWVFTGDTVQATLALVGMHIVGSAKGHPEMIWSTFEHKSNTPNAAYQYVNNQKKVVAVKPDNSGDWLFNSKPEAISIANANQRKAFFGSNKITGAINTTVTPKDTTVIQPSNTIRVLPWGSADANGKPNPENATTADANSQVIAINNSIINQLVGKDVRKNYLFIGSTWTQGQMAPNGKVFPKDNTKGSAVGTSCLANSTMETDFQLKSPSIDTDTGRINNCFTCHNGNGNNGRNGLDPKVHGLSHIFLPLMKGVKTVKAINPNQKLKEVKKK